MTLFDFQPFANWNIFVGDAMVNVFIDFSSLQNILLNESVFLNDVRKFSCIFERRNE
ncbi:MAG: hypothetical protein BWX51_00945 [Bacteroidetes bacterium ADurb.Bin012]|mgnify:CR=1 FL=1|jgi:hypothetical protein|nr:MAG: hypothetical protein BWX51_00945 [Bacteroidetes bacterium ADurb.Bin012]